MLTAEKYELYIGLGYHYWYRNIRNGRNINGDSVAGLLEEYYWYYGMPGYAANVDVNETVNVGFDFRYTQMFDAKMDVNFLGFKGYDDTSFNLGNRSGVRFTVPINMKPYSFIVSPYFEIIDIGKSNAVEVTSGGHTTRRLL